MFSFKKKKKSKEPVVADIDKLNDVVHEFLHQNKQDKKILKIKIEETEYNQVPLTNIKKEYKSPIIYVHNYKTGKMFVINIFGKYINISYADNNKIIPLNESELIKTIRDEFRIILRNLKNEDNNDLSSSYMYSNKLLMLTPILFHFENYYLQLSINDSFELVLTMKNHQHQVLKTVVYNLV